VTRDGIAACHPPGEALYSGMTQHEAQLPQNLSIILDRFIAACEADARVVAAFLGGSYASGTADAHSDLDLCLITTDGSYEDFLAGSEAFVRLLGEPVFLETFDHPHNLFFIFANGSECELAVGRAGAFTHIHGGPYRVLVDKQGILDGIEFPWHQADADEQRETLRRLIQWFWHDLSHFITAMARGQPWWAYGQLGILRRVCVNLARLRHDFAASVDDYDKIDHAVPRAALAPLAGTCCAMEHNAMLDAVHIIIRFYQETARSLAQAHGIPYPDVLERVMLKRLEGVTPRPIAPSPSALGG
jgi:predicted nucleotidyltransferase